jgi:hypothetical protein
LRASTSVSEQVSTAGRNALGVRPIVMGLAGHAALRVQPDQLAALRKNPGLPADRTLSAGFLKNSDDQTVLALTAVGRAMISLGRLTACYQEWGVVAAPNLISRLGTLQSLLAFRKDGAWGISPHLIPHHSLHAVSGTVSQALRIHGPNFGISGGPNAAAEAFLAAATLISENNVPGLWVVLSGHESEWVPQASDYRTGAPTCCLAAALALELPGAAGHAAYLHVAADGNDPDGLEFNLAAFMGALTSKAPAGRWLLPGCGRVHLCTTRGEVLP